MTNKTRAILWIGMAVMWISACSQAVPPQARVVEDYLRSLVGQDQNHLQTLSCADWVESALLEMDSLQGVKARLDGMACSVVGTQGTTTLVKCQGKIIATYNNEDQEFDLSVRTYKVVEQGGEYLVCGTS